MIMMIVCGVAAGLIFAAADIFFLCRKKTVAVCVHAVFRDVIIANLLSLGISKYLFGVENVFNPALHGPVYLLKFFALTLFIGAVLFFIKGIIDGAFVFEKSALKHKAWAWVMRIAAAVFMALGLAAYTGTLWGKDTFGDMTPDQMLINLNSPIGGTSPDIMNSLYEGPVLITAVLTAVFCVLTFSNRRIVYRRADGRNAIVFPGLARRIIALVLALTMLSVGVAFGVTEFQLFDIYSAYMDSSPFIEENFTDPRTTSMKFPEKKRNLIHIYMESMENTFASKDLGGYSEVNLIPELTELRKNGYSFSHQNEGMGGAIPSSGSGWSVAGMVNMGIGLPMKVPVDGNSYGAPDNFLPGAYALGDILHDNGYEQSLMFGADATFGGLNFYFESHGNFNILDVNGVKELGWLPEDYHVWWGYEDKKLFDFAKKELTRLSETGKPFHFVMETADTHATDGYLDPEAPTPYEKQYENVVAFSSKQVSEFIKWIEAQPFYENTTIVLIGDHLSMDHYFADFDSSSYQRTVYNMILNPAPNVRDIPQERMYNREWAVFDMFPTMLASIGVEIEGNRLGLGTNLFSEEKTLFERNGVAETNAALVERSNFYNENILTKKD